jgi:hypothetical protein
MIRITSAEWDLGWVRHHIEQALNKGIVMGITMKPLPAPEWLRGLADARAAYQELLGWPVSVQVGERHLVVAIGSVLGAIEMPAVLGARVRAQLDRPAPIVANADGTRWTFLGRPGAPGGHGIPALQLLPLPAGSYVTIPAELTESDEPTAAGRWIGRPLPGRPLPPAADILALARKLRWDGCLQRTA